MSEEGITPDSWSVGKFMKNVVYDVITSPINAGLLMVCAFLVYKILRVRTKEQPPVVERVRPPKMKKQDLSLNDLRKYNGTNEDGRVLVAVCGKIFDVTYSGKQFYGPGGPYEVFAGRDASRALATFSLDGSALRDEYDDLSDLRSDQMASLKEWELQFSEKYIQIGKLLKPGDVPTHYSDEEEDEEDSVSKSGKHDKAE